MDPWSSGSQAWRGEVTGAGQPLAGRLGLSPSSCKGQACRRHQNCGMGQGQGGWPLTFQEAQAA